MKSAVRSRTIQRRKSRSVVATLVLMVGCGPIETAPDEPAKPAAKAKGGAGSATAAAEEVTACEVVSGGIAELVTIPAGEFYIGCNEDVDNECRDEERPGRTVTLSEFAIDRTEITQDQYAACVADGGCELPLCQWDCAAVDLPALCVTRAHASAYCAWAQKRLPTEAEWEKAARGNDGRKYPWGNDPPSCELTNMVGCANGAEAVGARPAGASPYGVLDMAGNVVEMAADWYDVTYYQAMPDADPPGPAEGTRYSSRGGGWRSEPFWHRTSVRDWQSLEDQGLSLGFRCAQ
jgi:formylglycine-generating enzyme required for sulfatase activity